jgi:hypothetical protein
MLTMNNLGDGSTLNLDFTTMGGVLDPRLTFSRASTATFVNSSGYVEWAASNEMTYSQSQDSNTFWNAFGTNVVRTSAQTDPNGGSSAVKLVFNATAADAVISRTVAVNNGLPYTISMWMRADSGTLTNVRFGRGATAAGAFFPTLTTTWQRVSLSFTASGSADGIEIRVLNSGSPQTATFHVYGAQLESGSTVRAYQPAVAAAAYYAPRFDYSPTNIGEPRGLLIEGSAINSALYSENINPNSSPQNIYWVVSGTGASVTPVSQTDPANGSTASRCILGTSTVGRVYQAFSTTSGATYTMSFWAKSVSGNTALHFWHYNSATGNYTAVTVGTSWARYQVTILAKSGGGFVEFGIANLTATAATVDLWGMQVELGSGASSYIPTGASQVTRTADNCYLTDFAGWSAGGNFNTAEGTLFVDQAVTFVGTVNYPAGGFCTSNTVGSRFGWQYRQGDAPQGYRGLVNAGYLYETPYPSGWSIPAGTIRFRHAMSCGGNTFLRQSFKSSASSGSPTQNTYSDVSTLNISGVAAFTLTQSTFASSVRIARVKYYPRAFTLTELDQLTN